MAAADAMGQGFDDMMQHGGYRSAETARRLLQFQPKKAVRVGTALAEAVAALHQLPQQAKSSAAASAINMRQGQGQDK